MTDPVTAEWQKEELPERVEVDGKIYVRKETLQSRWMDALQDAMDEGKAHPSEIRYSLHRLTELFMGMHQAALMLGRKEVSEGVFLTHLAFAHEELGELYKLVQKGIRGNLSNPDNYTQITPPEEGE